tara:strand:- start:16496 stop:17428 length:933 start_codon:yes stop_codon:yes gene_type:complete
VQADDIVETIPTRRTFGAVRRWFRRSALSAADWDALEEILITADLGPRLSMELIEELRETVNTDGSVDVTRAHKVMIEHLGDTITNDDAEFASGHPPQVIFVVGVNGVGKTTSIAKLAYMLRGLGHEVLLAAGDTFRAGAIDQLKIWGKNVGVSVVAHKAGSDPGAVVYDALDAAKAREVDYVIVDSAGRQHTNVNLMNELSKMRRVAGRQVEGAPHEVLLVIDAMAGQNGLQQAQGFLTTAGVTGIVLTKLDSSAKGGSAFAVAREAGVPIKFAGTGERVEDFSAFDPRRFVKDILDKRPDEERYEVSE